MLGRYLDVQKKMEKLVWRSLKIDLPRDLLFENFDTCKFVVLEPLILCSE